VAVYTSRTVKPVVAAVTTNHPTNVVPVNVETRFTVTFDRPMDQSVQPSLVLSSGDATSVPAVSGGSCTNNQTWRSGALVFTPANGGSYTLAVSLAKDLDGRVMNTDNSYAFSV